jgi:hypothetical protein
MRSAGIAEKANTSDEVIVERVTGLSEKRDPAGRRSSDAVVARTATCARTLLGRPDVGPTWT